MDNCVDGWTPLTDEYKRGKSHWTKIYFKKPAIASALVVYLAAIVSSPLDPSPPPPPMIKFELHGATSDEKTTQDYQVTKYCKENPITIPIHHDMTKPFFKTHYIKMKFSEDVKIAAVSLRSPKYFDPVELQKCTGIEWVYDIRFKKKRGINVCSVTLHSLKCFEISHTRTNRTA